MAEKKPAERRTSEFNNNARVAPAQLISQVRGQLPTLNDTMRMGDETITPTKNQREILRLIKCKDIVFINGPIGTGKTLWAVYAGLEGLANGTYKKLALTAPAVEADEQLGFLTGDKDEKMHVHVNQILETIDDLIGKTLREKLVESGVIEIAPHAFNRGRTYKNTLYILDESQNASARQLMTSIGRLGFNSTFVYMGDDRQNDRTANQSAYVKFVERFTQPEYKEEIGSVTMGTEDVRRHPLLLKIVRNGHDRALDGFEKRQDSRIAAPDAAPKP